MSIHSSRRASPISSHTTSTYHELYYLEDGLIIEVERTLFKVPRYMLCRKSSILSEILAPCQYRYGPGSSNLNPIRLGDVTVDAFTCILSLLYPMTTPGDMPVYESWSESKWVAVLSLATLWDMQNIRNFAIEQLSSSCAAISKIRLGKEYAIHRWVREGYLDLCLRRERLSLTDAENLGLEQTLLVAAARERIREEIDPSERTLEEERSIGYREEIDPSERTLEKEERSTGYSRIVTWPAVPGVHAILDEVFGLVD